MPYVLTSTAWRSPARPLPQTHCKRVRVAILLLYIRACVCTHACTALASAKDRVFVGFSYQQVARRGSRWGDSSDVRNLRILPDKTCGIVSKCRPRIHLDCTCQGYTKTYNEVSQRTGECFNIWQQKRVRRLFGKNTL